MTANHSMSSADAAWLHMDRATNLMVINAVLWFDRPLDPEAAKSAFRTRIVERFPRFGQRVVEGPLGRAHWEDDPEFDPEVHFHHLALPAPGDRAALQELVGDLAATPLDRTRPLWQMYVVDGYGEGSAVVVRMHHCIADGIALARVMMLLTDESNEADSGIAPSGDDGRDSPLRALMAPAAAAASAARGIAGALVHEGAESLVHPHHALELARRAAEDARTAGKLLATAADADSVLRGDLHVARRVAWSERIPLKRVKSIGRARAATVNDVLVAAVAGAFARHLEARDSLVDELRALVPFNLRPLDRPLPRELGNRFGLILLSLPVGVADTAERLAEVKRRMDDIKHSHEGVMAYGILSAMGMAPVQVQLRLVDFFSAKGTAVVTNVPGPRTKVSVAGVPVRGVLVWAPTSGQVGISVSIFSYAGEVTVGFLADAGLVPDPHAIVGAFQDEIRALSRLPRRRSRRQS